MVREDAPVQESKRTTAAPDAFDMGELADVVMSVGCKDFGSSMLHFMNRVCGADHIHIFDIDGRKPRTVLAGSIDASDKADELSHRYLHARLWKYDRILNERIDAASTRRNVVHAAASSDPIEIREHFYRPGEICERLVMCGRTQAGFVGFSLPRSASSGPFSAQERNRLEGMAELAFGLVSKHYLLTRSRFDDTALASIRMIEENISAIDLPLSRRESEVSARIIFGMASREISEHLGIGYETVISYRKKIYERLEISSNRELLIQYLQATRNLLRS